MFDSNKRIIKVEKVATTEDIQNEDIYEYSEDRYEYIVDFLNRHFEADANIVEIGCGSGNILKYIDEKTKIKNLIRYWHFPKKLLL